MPRPSPETTERSYNETYISYHGDDQTGYAEGLHTWTAKRRIYIGSSTPGYPRKKRNNPFFMSYHTMDPTPGRLFTDINISDPSFYSIATGVLDETQVHIPSNCPYQISSVSHDTAVMNKAINAAMDEVQDRKVNYAQFIAERKQVVNMVNDVVARVTKAITAIRRRDFRKASRALGLTRNPKNLSSSVASNWLAYQYGWQPLLSDVKGAAEHLARNSFGRPMTIRVNKRRSFTSPVYDQTTVSGGLDGNSYGGNIRVYFDGKKTDARIGLTFEVTNDLVRQSSELGIHDPITLAWELLPYSFVVDWFLPVGNFLQRLNYDSGLSFRSGYTVYYTSQKGNVSNVETVTSVGGGQRVFFRSDGFSFENRHLLRQVLLQPPRPVLPSFKDPFSPVHTLNALALMRVAFGR